MVSLTFRLNNDDDLYDDASYGKLPDGSIFDHLKNSIFISDFIHVNFLLFQGCGQSTWLVDKVEDFWLQSYLLDQRSP